jgi:hypothetical protein
VSIKSERSIDTGSYKLSGEFSSAAGALRAGVGGGITRPQKPANRCQLADRDILIIVVNDSGVYLPVCRRLSNSRACKFGMFAWFALTWGIA